MNVTGLAVSAAYAFSAYSDGSSSTLLATATQFTTQPPPESGFPGFED